MSNLRKELDWPEIALVAITRAALGAGIGLLLAHRLSQAGRAAAGWALLLFGIVTTLPLAAEEFGGRGGR